MTVAVTVTVTDAQQTTLVFDDPSSGGTIGLCFRVWLVRHPVEGCSAQVGARLDSGQPEVGRATLAQVLGAAEQPEQPEQPERREGTEPWISHRRVLASL